jgi:hypothetical protein
MSHILGFSQYKWGNFITENGTAIPLDQVVKNETRPTPTAGVTRTVTVLITPTILEKAREHFGCPTLTGLEVENYPATGTYLSHWEERILLSEYMVGSAQDFPVITAMTLAYFEDSGWYKANYSAAGVLQWGLNQGCDFVYLPCKQWNSFFTCTDPSQNGCTADRKAIGFCTITDESVPADYAFWGSEGGQDALADYCPYYASDGTSGFCTLVSNGSK